MLKRIGLISMAAMLVCSLCCGGDEEEAKPPKPKITTKQKVVEPPPPSFSDVVREEAKAVVDAVMKCRTSHLSKIYIQAYRKGDVEAFGVDFNAMDNACEPTITLLFKRLNELVALDKKLDEVLFQAARFRDLYSRVSLFTKRIGDKRRKMVKKNTQRLERFLGETRAATDDLKRAVEALDGRDFEKSSSFDPARRSFISSLASRFETYMEKPVKAKTASYHRISKFLVAGTTRIYKRARATSARHQQAMGKLVRELKQARALYQDYLVASKSKKKVTKEIKKLANQALDGLKP
jgi:hypothetical protein